MHRLKLPVAIPILILFTLAVSAHAAEPHYSGSASLSKPSEPSTNSTVPLGIHVDLRPAPPAGTSGRFELNARVQTDQIPNGNSCGSVADLIFRNGFD
mgnify:CR=1 FL=1